MFINYYNSFILVNILNTDFYNQAHSKCSKMAALIPPKLSPYSHTIVPSILTHVAWTEKNDCLLRCIYEFNDYSYEFPLSFPVTFRCYLLIIFVEFFNLKLCLINTQYLF